MQDTKKAHPVLQILASVGLAVTLFGLSFMVLLLPPVTKTLAEATISSTFSPYNDEQLVAIAVEGLQLVLGKDNVTIPYGEDEIRQFSRNVMSHMLDVRVVLQTAILVVSSITVVTASLLVIVGFRGGKRALSPVLIAGGIAPLAAAAVFGVIGVMNFDALFSWMHSLFFAEGTWTFAWDSLLITVYPIGFWIGMAVTWAVVLVLFSTVCMVLGFRFRATVKK